MRRRALLQAARRACAAEHAKLDSKGASSSASQLQCECIRSMPRRTVMDTTAWQPRHRGLRGKHPELRSVARDTRGGPGRAIDELVILRGCELDDAVRCNTRRMGPTVFRPGQSRSSAELAKGA